MLRKTIISISVGLALSLTGCGGGKSTAPTVKKELSEDYFYNTSNVGTTNNSDGSSVVTSYDGSTKEYKIVFFNTTSKKEMEISLKSTDKGISQTKEVVYIDKNDIYTGVAHEMVAGAIQQTRTFNPPSLLIPYGDIGDKFSFHTQEKLSMPSSMDTIPAGTCGGPSNTLTEWEFIEQDREIEIVGKETITIDNTQIEAIKVKILMTEYNKPKYSTCDEKNTLNPTPLYIWVAKGKGLVKSEQ